MKGDCMRLALRRAVRLLAAVGLAAPAFTVAAPAGAAEPYRPFGSRGQVVLSDLVAVRSGGIGFLGVASAASMGVGMGGPALSGLVGFAHDRYTLSQAAGGPSEHISNNVSVAPSFDVFVAHRLSL